jgi:uncharacterized membrane protein
VFTPGLQHDTYQEGSINMTSQTNIPDVQTPPTAAPVTPPVVNPPVVKKKASWSIRTLAYGGIFTAYFLMVPLPSKTYIHLGDGVIFIASMILGPFAGIPAALGSALADFNAGYSFYVPATIIIKGFMGSFAGFMLLKTRWKHILPYILVFAAAEVFMVGGYFAYEAVVLRLGVGVAAANILPNAIQAIAGVAIGTACIPAMLRFRKNAKPASGPDA